jgi:hypothetical protein
LRDRIDYLIKYPAVRAAVGAANQAKARAAFDEGAMIASYAALYDAAMGRPGTLGAA